MKLESFRAKGFIGFRDGLGLEEVAVDFSNVSGLTAIQGANGSGKTTLTELLSPFPQFASREGALFRHTYMRSSEREQRFFYDGNHYRTLLKIDCQSEKQEGYIWRDGKSEVNGKISSYVRYVRDLLGSAELFYNSVFCAQGSKKLSDLRTGELKDLFAEFLRLGRIQKWEDTAKQAGNILTGKVSQLDIRRVGLTDRLQGIEDLKVKAAGKAAGIETLEDKKAHYAQEIQAARARIDDLKAIVAKNALAVSRKADVQATIDRLTSDLSKEKQAAETELEGIRAKYRNLAAELSKCEAVLKDKEKILGAAEREQTVNTEIEGITREIEQVTEEATKQQGVIHSLDKKLLELRQAVKDLDNDEFLKNFDMKLADLKAEIEAQDRKIKELKEDRQVYDLETKIANAREKMAALELRDPTCTSSACSFIVDAFKSEELLPGLQEELGTLKSSLWTKIKGAESLSDEYRESMQILGEERTKRVLFIDGERKRLNKEADSKGIEARSETHVAESKAATINARRQFLARLRLEASMLKDLAAKKADVQVAEARKADLSARQAELTEKGKTSRVEWEEKERAFKSQIEEQEKKMDGIDLEIDVKAEQNLLKEQGWLRGIESKDFPALESEILEAREELAKIRGELSRMSEAQKELETADLEKGRLQTEVSEWIYLKNACSKNGLQALEIDGSAPLISSYANELLSQAFGPLYSVKLRTQNEEGKEVLDIVTIGEQGEEVLLENLSGGQRVWILMALRLGMTLLSKEKSGHELTTGFADELDGSLDKDNAINFVNMYRSFMKVGGFQDFFFISHRSECRNLSDNVLIFEHGKNPYWR